MKANRSWRGVLARALGTLAVLVIAGVCVRLGVWQLDRLAQRKARNEVIAARMAEPVLELGSVHLDTSGLIYRVVEVEGEYDAGRGVVLAGRSHQGATGANLLMPLRLPEGGSVLVQRGWLPALDASQVDPTAYAAAGPVKLRGLLLAFPDLGAAHEVAAGDQFRRVWYRFDGAAMRRQLPYPAFGLYLQLLPAVVTTESSYPVALPAPDLDDGPHLGYAIQWFSFALIALVGWVVLLMRREGRGAAGRVATRSERGPLPVR